MERVLVNIGDFVTFDLDYVNSRTNGNGIRVKNGTIVFDTSGDGDFSTYDEYSLTKVFRVTEIDSSTINVETFTGKPDAFHIHWLRKAKATDVATYRKLKNAA